MVALYFIGKMPLKNQARLSCIVCTKSVLDPRTITFEDQAMGFDFLAPYFVIMFKAMGLDSLVVLLKYEAMPFDSLVVPPQNEAIYTIFFAKKIKGMTYWYITRGYVRTFFVVVRAF